MHELQMMQKIVRMVEGVCEHQHTGVPSLVRLQISNHSHLAEHTPQELETTFHLAATGTPRPRGEIGCSHDHGKGKMPRL